ncbi:hypothetical protein [Streptomyces sp. N35]|uniref:hypothetical protein n=1 Tax=Streptomyces sp. N35 TaxID=2795730 RepID=UPI0018F72A6E|nr:hypothetical protein [Streptomyces sp. N35]
MPLSARTLSKLTAAPGANTVPISFYRQLVQHMTENSGVLAAGPGPGRSLARYRPRHRAPLLSGHEPVARTFRTAGQTECGTDGERLLVPDIGHTIGMVVEVGTTGSLTAVTDNETGPDNALLDGCPVTSFLRLSGGWGGGTTRVRVTARWGWPTVPDEVVRATLIQAARLSRRKDFPEGVTGSAEWGVVRLSRIDPNVYALVKHFVLPASG